MHKIKEAKPLRIYLYALSEQSLDRWNVLWATANKRKSEKMDSGYESGRFVIDRSAYRTNCAALGFCVVWLIIWVPGTALITHLVSDENSTFIYFWIAFAIFAALLVPYALFSRKRKQMLEVSGDSLVVHGAGILPSSKACIEKQNLKALTLERRKVGNTKRESFYTLNLFKKRGLRHNRIILANFMHPEDLATLFEKIRGFLQASGFVFDVKNTWVREENSNR